jgi:hypothetical protein
MIQDGSEQHVLRRYLENMQILFTPPCLNLRDNLRIRRLLESERKAMYFGKADSFESSIESLTVAIEISFTFRKNVWNTNDYGEAMQEVATVLEALLLFRDALVKLKGETESKEELSGINNTERYASMSYVPFWRRFIAPHHRIPLELNSSDVRKFRQFWENVDRLMGNHPYLKMSIARFGAASQMAGEPTEWNYRFVDYVASMEALLTELGPEVSLSLRTRMAALLGRSDRESQDVFDFMRSAYRIRSALVHGASLEELMRKKFRQMPPDFEEALGRLHSYSRNSIRSAITLTQAGFDTKKDLLRLVDLAGLRSDLRDLMRSVLDERQNSEQLVTEFKKADEEHHD